ncbi:MAG: hypothetical protein F6K24_21920 [Okeania sp. SIO2D1]|nr:hypothetical protein [Okeania sp. SIO2D1]
MSKEEFRASDPELVEMRDLGVRASEQIKNYLGIKVTSQTDPMKFLNSLADKVGLKAPRLRRENKEGKRTWVYGRLLPNWAKNEKGKILLDEYGQAIPILDERQQVFQAWLKQDEERLAKEVQVREEQKQQAAEAQKFATEAQTQPEEPQEEPTTLLEKFAIALQVGNNAVRTLFQQIDVRTRIKLAYEQISTYSEEIAALVNKLPADILDMLAEPKEAIT